MWLTLYDVTLPQPTTLIPQPGRHLLLTQIGGFVPMKEGDVSVEVDKLIQLTFKRDHYLPRSCSNVYLPPHIPRQDGQCSPHSGRIRCQVVIISVDLVSNHSENQLPQGFSASSTESRPISTESNECRPRFGEDMNLPVLRVKVILEYNWGNHFT